MAEPSVTTADIAEAFAQIADLLELTGADAFRINSYRKVARVLDETPEDVPALAREGRLTGLPGVGRSSADKIAQMVSAGRIDLLEELRAKVPPGLPQLMRIQGLGPKTVAKLWHEAGVTDLASLSEAIDAGGLEGLRGMGAKKVRQIFEGIQFLTSAGNRVRLGDATELARRVVATMEQVPGVQKVTPAGSLRRGRDTVGDLDILCQADPADAERIIDAFTRMTHPPVRRVLGAGDTKASVVLDRDVQADLRVVGPESYGAALQYFTGSKEHSVRLREIVVKKGWKLNEYGLFDGETRLAGDDEGALYAKLGMAWIPPELRENRGEIEAALEGRLPDLLRLEQVRGDLHMHTVASDGLESIETMIRACAERGYAYMAIAEHSRSQHQANGLDAARLAEHRAAVREAAGAFGGIDVYFSCEVDILKDGAMDFPDEVLETLDFAIGSPHAALQMKRAEATKRILRAIENPFVRIIGHPTGRITNARPGMELDLDEIAAAAAEHDTALEVNCHTARLDLRDVHVRAAIEHGARLVLNTDAHGVADLDNMRFGVITARRGWAQAKDVVNALPAARFRNWVRKGRA